MCIVHSSKLWPSVAPDASCAIPQQQLVLFRLFYLARVTFLLNRSSTALVLHCIVGQVKFFKWVVYKFSSVLIFELKFEFIWKINHVCCNGTGYQISPMKITRYTVHVPVSPILSTPIKYMILSNKKISYESLNSGNPWSDKFWYHTPNIYVPHPLGPPTDVTHNPV